jgi:hypothetical protein
MKSPEQASLFDEYTVAYPLPDIPAAFLLTPSARGPDHSAREIAQDPSLIEGQVLGQCKIVQQLHPKLPPSDYEITLARDGETVVFTGVDGSQVEYGAVIRELPQPVPGPTALITASQIGLAWGQTQICALMETPLPEELTQRLREAIKHLQEAGILKAGEEAFALTRAIPSALGRAQTTEGTQPSGQPEGGVESLATTLVMPTVRDGAFPPPSETEAITGIGLFTALTDIELEVFYDVELKEPAGFLPAGDYLYLEVRLDDAQPTPGQVYEARGRLLGPPGDFYVPILGGLPVIGQPLRGSGPAGQDEVIILNLEVASRCRLKVRTRCWILK